MLRKESSSSSDTCTDRNLAAYNTCSPYLVPHLANVPAVTPNVQRPATSHVLLAQRSATLVESTNSAANCLVQLPVMIYHAQNAVKRSYNVVVRSAILLDELQFSHEHGVH